MVEFLIESDLEEASFMRPDGEYLVKQPMLGRFFKQTNEWYYEMALEFGVEEESIALFVQPNIENRSPKMKRLAKYHLLMYIFQSLSADKEDIYWTKYLDAKEQFEKLEPTMNYYEIIGETPAQYTDSSDFSMVDIFRS